MNAFELIVGGGLVVYGLILKSKGRELFSESLDWEVVFGIGVLCIIYGLFVKEYPSY